MVTIIIMCLSQLCCSCVSLKPAKGTFSHPSFKIYAQIGEPWGLSGIWIQRYYCRGSDHCCGVSSVPGGGIFLYHRCHQKTPRQKNKQPKKKKNREDLHIKYIEAAMLIPSECCIAATQSSRIKLLFCYKNSNYFQKMSSIP